MAQAVNEVFTSLLSKRVKSSFQPALTVPPFAPLFRPFLRPGMPPSFCSTCPSRTGSARFSWWLTFPSPYFECFFWDCSSPKGSHVHLPFNPDHSWAHGPCCHVPTIFSACEYSAFQIRLWVAHEAWGIPYHWKGSKGFSWSLGFGCLGFLPTLSLAGTMTV